MLAPIYGVCDFDDQPWVNYHRFARSLWCPSYDPEFDVLLWKHRTELAAYSEVLDSLRTAGIRVHLIHDILPDYVINPFQYEISTYDKHPNAKANEIIGRYVVSEILRKRGYQPNLSECTRSN